MSSLNRPVLVLNKMWIPIRIVSVKRCLKLVFADKASMVNPSDYFVYSWDKWIELDSSMDEYSIQTTSSRIKVPEVIILLKYDKVHRKNMRLTKRNIYIRDKYRCFTPDTLILLGNGQFIPIDKIKVNDIIIDAWGNKQIVEFINIRKHQKEIYQIKVRGNGDILNCTSNHEILTWEKGQKYALKKAKDCKKGGFRYGRYGDFLSEIVVNNKVFGENIKKIDILDYVNDLKYLKIDKNFVKHYSGKKVKRKIDIDFNFGKLIGYFLAEGSIFNDGTRTVFTFHIKEESFANEVKSIVKNVLGVESIERIDKDRNTRSITICSTIFNRFLKKWSFIKREKRIVYKNCSMEYLKGVLYGLILGDGNINKNLKRITVMLKVENLIRDMYIVSKICGINPLLSKTGYRKDGRVYKSCIYKCSEYNKIIDIIEMQDFYNGPNLKYRIFNKDRVLSPISSIYKKEYNGMVYDLQVSGTHTYIANFMCVHNCQYSGKQIGYKDADIDHIIPRSKGGKNSWDNMVVCDKKINRIKADKTPEEAGLTLIKKPIKPSHDCLLVDPKLNTPKSWDKFIKGNK